MRHIHLWDSTLLRSSSGGHLHSLRNSFPLGLLAIDIGIDSDLPEKYLSQCSVFDTGIFLKQHHPSDLHPTVHITSTGNASFKRIYRRPLCTLSIKSRAYPVADTLPFAPEAHDRRPVSTGAEYLDWFHR
eukprot:Gb_29765 [translate_table: standard]